ncbi:MAG: AMP-binding protein [Polaromonas sp.]
MTDFQAWAPRQPTKPAVIEAETGRVVTVGELDQQVQNASQWLVSLGLQAGDGIALLMENRSEMIALAMAARRAGLYYTAVSTHLTPPEIEHVLKDSEAKAVFVSSATVMLLQGSETDPSLMRFSVDDKCEGFTPFRAALAGFRPVGMLPERPVGRDMLYSSGTTGRPKGIRRPMVAHADRDKPDLEFDGWKRAYGFDEHAVYLSTAPLYHAAPLRYVVRTLDVGGCCVLMSKFDAEAALALIEKYQVTHSQWVPTMFVRLLKLSQEVRDQYDINSMQVAIHAAAPCPIHVKQAMLDWWGDVIFEYYAGSEGVGSTVITPQEWRAHPGSVGRPMAGKLHIVGEDGQDLPPGEVGKIYFSGVATFVYHNDVEKTKEAYNEHGWATYGDIGYVDEDGFLYLSDRRADLILSGGVNVYPQEIENVLSQHAAVDDVAVVGVPDDDFGEVPKAIVRLRPPHQPGVELADELLNFCADRLSRLKWPRSLVFEESLPRLETGKLLRRVLKERFRETPNAGYSLRPKQDSRCSS